MNKELTELSQTFAKLEKEYKILRAAQPVNVDSNKPYDDLTNKLMDNLYNAISNVHQRIDYANENNWKWQDSHVSQSTHLPKLTTSQHKELLKACKADQDYDVKKPIIYTKASRNGNTEFEVEFSKIK